MEKALASMSEWYAHHYMKVSTEKHKLLFLAQTVCYVDSPASKYVSVIRFSSKARRWGAGYGLDRHLTFDSHIDQLVAKCTGILIALLHAKHSTSRDILPHIVNALVMSSIRYCVSVYGTPREGTDTPCAEVDQLLRTCSRR